MVTASKKNKPNRPGHSVLAGDFEARVRRLEMVASLPKMVADSLRGWDRLERDDAIRRLAVIKLVMKELGHVTDRELNDLWRMAGGVGPCPSYKGMSDAYPPRGLWRGMSGVSLSSLGMPNPVQGMSPGFWRGLEMGGGMRRQGVAGWRLEEGVGLVRRGLVTSVRGMNFPGVVVGCLKGGYLWVHGGLPSMAADDPMGVDVVAGVLASGKLFRLPSVAGSPLADGDVVLWLNARPGVMRLLRSWGIPVGECPGPYGRWGLWVSPFFLGLFSVVMHPLMEAELLRMNGILGRYATGRPWVEGWVPAGYPLLPLWWWGMVYSGGVALMKPGMVPFCPSRKTVWEAEGAGWSRKTHLAGIREGWVADTRLVGLCREWGRRHGYAKG